MCLLQRGSLTQIPVVKETRVESGQFLLLSVLCMLFILVVLAVSATFFCVRQRSHLRMKEKLASLGTDTSTDATATYQVRPTPLSLSQSGGWNTSLLPDWTKKILGELFLFFSFPGVNYNLKCVFTD